MHMQSGRCGGGPADAQPMVPNADPQLVFELKGSEWQLESPRLLLGEIHRRNFSPPGSVSRGSGWSSAARAEAMVAES